MLWRAGVQTVLPPGYLCCGYPQRGAGQFDRADKTITDNRVLFHRVANTLNYLDIKTVVVSCGTCFDQLQGYKFDEIFPGSRIVDIHEFLLEKGITLPAGQAGYLYHDPCHSPMKQRDPMLTVKALVGDDVVKSERCCGESGTFGVSRPDIATQVRFRKEEELRRGEAALRERGATGRRDRADVVPELPARAVALPGRPAKRPVEGRLHRGRDGAPPVGRERGWKTTSPAPTPAASSACWSDPQTRTVSAGRSGCVSAKPCAGRSSASAASSRAINSARAFVLGDLGGLRGRRFGASRCRGVVNHAVALGLGQRLLQRIRPAGAIARPVPAPSVWRAPPVRAGRQTRPASCGSAAMAPNQATAPPPAVAATTNSADDNDSVDMRGSLNRPARPLIDRFTRP